MSNFRTKNFVKNYKLRIQRKFTEFIVEAENVSSRLSEEIAKVKEKTETVLQDDTEGFFDGYERAIEDIDKFGEKLFLISNILLSDEDDEVGDVPNEKKEVLEKNPPLEVESCQIEESVNCEPKGSASSVNQHFVSSDDLKTLNTKHIDSCSEERNLIQNIQNDYSTSVVDTSASHDSFFYSASSDSLESSQSCRIEKANVKNFKNVEKECEGPPHQEIPQPKVQVGSYIRAKLTEFQNPSEFWLQLWDSENTSMQSYSLNCSTKLNPSDVRIVQYCLAPYSGNGVTEDTYQRARIMNAFGSEENITVVLFYIDYGCKKLLDCRELHTMPSSYYAQPARAIRCYLDKVVDVGYIWSKEANEAFKQNVAYDPQILVASETNGRYAVDFKISTFGNDETFLSEYLCCLDLAMPVPSDSEVPLPYNIECTNTVAADEKASSETESTASNEYVDLSNLKILNTSKNTDNIERSATSYSDKKLTNEPGGFTGKQLSGDTEFEFDEPQVDEKSADKTENYSSSNIVRVAENSIPGLMQNSVCSDVILKDSLEFDWDIQIPPPRLNYVRDNLMLVIASAIYSPDEFYVNLACENAPDLDSIREQMNSFYEQRKDLKGPRIDAKNLRVGSYCCTQSCEDNGWYRAQIVEMKSDQTSALIQFVDYGDSYWVDTVNLRPLTKTFAKYPAFAILCSLAYIRPKSSDGKDGAYWDRHSVEAFKTIVGYEKCFTAQIVGNKKLLDGRTTLDVLLWDSTEAGERLVNDTIISEGLAVAMPEIAGKNGNELDIHEQMAEWDPLAADYHCVENSYGVNMNDVEIATVGYKGKDESYICKYYARYGRCHRSNCHYQHIVPDHGGTTVDREEVSCVENPENSAIIPPVHSRLLGQASTVLSPSHFYIVFPYGLTSVKFINERGPPETGPHVEFEALSKALNTYYKTAPFCEVTTMALPLGTIVAAKSIVTNMWHRARVLEVVDVDKPVKVFFVDVGSVEWVKRKDIRTIKKEFLFAPFQAVECFLTNVKPNNYDGGVWTSNSKMFFQKLVFGKMLIVDVDKRIGNALYVSLTLTDYDGAVRLNDLLVSEGFAQYESLVLARNYERSKLKCRENGIRDLSSLQQPG